MLASLLLLAILIAQGGAAAPPRDTRPVQPTGTGVIAGRVMSGDATPQPVRRAQVRVTRSDALVERTVVTDEDGRFSVDALPAGRYNVSATKTGSLRASYGAVQPGRPGTAFPLAASQRMTDLVLTMAKGAVISGVVTGANGRPAAGIQVRLLQFRYEPGERLLAQAAVTAGSSSEVTDDRGEYRLYGLAGGEYVVSAVPEDVSLGGLSTARGTVGYVPVYYPGTTDASESTIVKVVTGEETTGINFALQLVRTARVTGSVQAPESFSERDMRVTLVPAPSTVVVTTGSQPSNMANAIRMLATVGPDRTFAFNGITPGRYKVVAQAVERPTLTPEMSYASVIRSSSALWAIADIAVDGNDTTDVRLTMRPGLTVSGRVQFDATATGMTPVPDLTRVSVYLNSTVRSPLSLAGSFPSATVGAGGDFVIKGVMPGRYRVSASYANNLANGWSAANAMLDGRDTLDMLLDVPADGAVEGLSITMTRATQSVTGIVQDATGRPTPGLTVVVFPSDRALWSVGRRLRNVRSGQDGRYTISNLTAGDYRLAALTDLNPGEFANPAFLEQLLPASIQIVVKPGERKVQDLRVIGR